MPKYCKHLAWYPALAWVALFSCGVLAQQNYPNKQITLIAPDTFGGQRISLQES